MTASKTPNLELMNPVLSDEFTVEDFQETMGILDQHPGIRTVANQAARPVGWTYTQHGRRVWQADQNIEWVWHQPTSGDPGEWKRTFPKGILAQSYSGSQISTSTTNWSGGVTIGLLNNVIIPGGRDLKIGWSAEWLGNSAGAAMMSYWENGSRIVDIHHTGFSFVTNTTIPHAQGHSFLRFPGATQQTMSFKLTMAAHPSWGGTSYTWGCWFTIEEV